MLKHMLVLSVSEDSSVFYCTVCVWGGVCQEGKGLEKKLISSTWLPHLKKLFTTMGWLASERQEICWRETHCTRIPLITAVG